MCQGTINIILQNFGLISEMFITPEEFFLNVHLAAKRLE